MVIYDLEGYCYRKLEACSFWITFFPTNKSLGLHWMYRGCACYRKLAEEGKQSGSYSRLLHRLCMYLNGSTIIHRSNCELQLNRHGCLIVTSISVLLQLSMQFIPKSPTEMKCTHNILKAPTMFHVTNWWEIKVISSDIICVSAFYSWPTWKHIQSSSCLPFQQLAVYDPQCKIQILNII